MVQEFKKRRNHNMNDEKIKIKKRLFVPDKTPWIEYCNKKVCFDKKLSFQEVEHGYILPLKIIKNKIRISDSEGGVCDKDFNFLEGNIRSFSREDTRSTCQCSYQPNTPVLHRKETVIFGGILQGHYGHQLVEGFNHLWWFAEHPETSYKIVFLVSPFYNNGLFPFVDMLKALGLESDRYEIISSPTSFDKIIVPEQSCIFAEGYYREHKNIFDLMIKNTTRISTTSPKKIYFTRSKFRKKDGINEEYFVEFYRKRDFHIIYPDELTFTEKIILLQNAEEFVSIYSSAIFALFCAKEGLKVTILIREGISDISHQFPIEMRNIDCYFVHVNFNFLPTIHAGFNCYLYGPTKHWVDYLDANNIPYTEEEVSLDLHLKPYIYDYILSWEKNYSKPLNYKRIRNFDLIDILSRIRSVFEGKSTDRESYLLPDPITKLNKIVSKLEDKNKINDAKLSILEDTLKKSLGNVTIKENQILLTDLNDNHKLIIKNQDELIKRLNSNLEEVKLMKKEQTASLSKELKSVKEELKIVREQLQMEKEWREKNVFRKFIDCFFPLNSKRREYLKKLVPQKYKQS